MSSNKHLFGYDKNHFSNLLVQNVLKIDDETSLEDFEIYNFDDKLKIDKGNTNIISIGANQSNINKLGILTTPSTYDLEISGDINLSGTLRKNGDIHSLLFSKNGSDIYYNDGSAGIGTSTPNTLFSVEDNDNVMNIYSSQSGTGRSAFLKLGLSQIVSTTTSSTNELSLKINNNGVLTEGLKINQDKSVDVRNDFLINNFFYVDSNNNRVGVKNVTPLSTLHLGNGSNESFINFNSQRSWSLLMNGSGSGNTSLDLKANVNGKILYIKNQNDTDVAVINTNNSASSQRVHLVPSGGRVGINKTNPSTTLDVVGNIRASGWIRYADSYNTHGRIINVNNQECSSSDVIITPSSSYQTAFSLTYTPVSSSSILLIRFDGRYRMNGSGDDFAWSNITINGTAHTYHRIDHQNNSGGGGRSQNLIPINSLYTNTDTTTKTIILRVLNGGNDNIVFRANQSAMRIFEISSVSPLIPL